MSYLNRLGAASYTAPSGASFSFAYTTLIREVTHRIGAFEFSGINGTLHQDKGVSGELYPLRVIFHGANYDTAADGFLEAIKETGPGVLNHPRWGARRVQVLSCRQGEKLVENVGQAVLEVVFQESLEREFPLTAIATPFEVPGLAGAFQTAIANNYQELIQSAILGDTEALKATMLGALGSVTANLTDLAGLDPDVSALFAGYVDDLLINIDTYVDDPGEFARILVSAIRVPVRVPGRIDLKLQSYTGLLNTRFVRSTIDTSTASKNALLTDELVGAATVVAASESVNVALDNTSTLIRSETGRAVISVPLVTDGYRTRGEALASAVYLRDSFLELVSYLDEGQVIFKEQILSRAYVQEVESYSPMGAVTYTVIKAALDLAFSLPFKRSIILPADSTITNQCYDLYGSIDDETLDYFILTNGLEGDSILLLPRGREVVYYA